MTTTHIRPGDTPVDFEPGSGIALDRRGRRMPKVEVFHEPQAEARPQPRSAPPTVTVVDQTGLARDRGLDGVYRRPRVPEDTDEPLTRDEKEQAAVKRRFALHEEELERQNAIKRRNRREQIERDYRRDPVEASLDHGYNPIDAFDEQMERRDRY